MRQIAHAHPAQWIPVPSEAEPEWKTHAQPLFEPRAWEAGSSSRGCCQWRRRAAWAVVQIDHGGVATRTLSGPLVYSVQKVPAAGLTAATYFPQVLSAYVWFSRFHCRHGFVRGRETGARRPHRPKADFQRKFWDICEDMGAGHGRALQGESKRFGAGRGQ